MAINSKSLIGGILAGAAVGIAIGILLAPASGEETRNNLVKGSKKLADDLKNKFDDSIESIKNQFNYRVEEVASAGKEGINHVKERAKV
jgi:gas vesicle protein